MLLPLLVAGYRSVAHYLVLTQQASGAHDTEQAVGEEAATSSAESDVQPGDVPVQEGTIAEPSGTLPDLSVLSLTPPQHGAPSSTDPHECARLCSMPA